MINRGKIHTNQKYYSRYLRTSNILNMKCV